jgi:hypothetical protein
LRFIVFLSLFLLAISSKAQESVDAINVTLDAWHKSSGEVKFGPFINSLAADAIILGDRPTGALGIKTIVTSSPNSILNPKYGWNYTYQNRYVHFNGDSTTAWFDETFKINTKYFRGTVY